MPRRSVADAARTRLDIVAAARRRFAAEGYAAATTTAIAREAGVSQSGLFHHFADKRTLFTVVLEEVLHGYDEEVRRAALSASTPMAMMLAGCRRSLELAADPEWARIVVMDAPTVLDETELRRIDASLGRATTRFGLAALTETGDLDPATDVDALTTVVYGALTEAAFDLARDARSVAPDRVIAVIARLLQACAPPTSVRARRR